MSYVVIIEDVTKGATLAKTEHKVKTGIPFPSQTKQRVNYKPDS